MQIQVSEAVKAKGDVAAVGTSALAYFKAIPWPELAAALAAVYTLLRIVEWFWDRFGKHPKG